MASSGRGTGSALGRLWRQRAAFAVACEVSPRMRTEPIWAEDIPERDGSPPVIYSIDFSPNGSRLLVAIGARVLVYDSDNGALIHSLKGDNRPTRAPPCATTPTLNDARGRAQGTRAPSTVWRTRSTGLSSRRAAPTTASSSGPRSAKASSSTRTRSPSSAWYARPPACRRTAAVPTDGNAPDQAYNPSKHLLASCTATDFGLWTPEQKGGDRVSARRISPPLTGLGSRA